ncbi:MAG TPA: tetratricopeptide repeat protein [Anaeromyxobacter sp.]|nr:tetratricopeptide repeat protein [Anaeromyxobacter sp.]
MPSSIVDKYQQIFAADPRSRIFVELAKALLERGEPEQAIEVCRTGLEHHPSSILGRVVWGRSLLEQGDVPGARDQFEIAIALDPGSPYAYNLVGEALHRKSLFREALPVLARAVDLQPADARLRAWLEEARAGAAHGAAAEVTASFQLPPQRPDGAGPATAPASPPPGPGPARDPSPPGPAPAPAAATSPAPTPPAPLVPPPVPATAPPPLSPSLHRDEVPRSLLAIIPGATRPGVAAAQAPAASPVDEEEAERIAARYEQEVRERLLSEPEPPPPFHRRHRGLLLAGILVAAGACATALFLFIRAAGLEREAAGAASRARAGLARDTAGALREAHRLLGAARQHSSAPELTSLAAQVAAVLATEHGDEEARALAAELSTRAEAGDGGRAAAYLLAEPAARAAAEASVLSAPPSSDPFLQALAGRILLRRGETEAGRGRLEIAARAAPPLLRALSDLGDAALDAGDPEGALGYYGAALSAVPTHPRSVVGAAEARLALGLDLPRARAELEAVAADPGSAPPHDLRLRYEVAFAHVLVATGEPASAAARLATAAEQLGESAALASAAAEAHLATRSYERAEASAARAVALAPGDAPARALLARARIGRGRYAEALAATAGVEGRAVCLQRAIARFRLGQIAEARRELEKTAHEGRMPAEAAVWYALTDLKLGRVEQARSLLEKLVASRSAPPLTLVALGQALEASGKAEEAEAAYRAAVGRDPAAPEGHAALGLLLLAHGQTAESVPELQKAAAADPADMDLRRSLGAARLATGQPALARAELDAVLTGRPADLEALRLLAAAWLAEGQPREARRAADRGLARDPGNVPLLVSAARAALAQGDRAAARQLTDRALKAAGRGPLAAEARALQAELKRR